MSESFLFFFFSVTQDQDQHTAQHNLIDYCSRDENEQLELNIFHFSNGTGSVLLCPSAESGLITDLVTLNL